MDSVSVKTFFNMHTYYAWDNFLNQSKCEEMTKEIFQVQQKFHQKKPQLYHKLVQYNTQHLPTQGLTHKYQAIHGDTIKYFVPSVWEYYINPDIIQKLSKVAGVQLYTVPSHNTVDQSIQLYSKKGDSANWHHDRSIFNEGRVFTFLTVVHNTSDQELLIWTKQFGTEKIKWEVGKAALIEKFKTFHSVTPLNYGERILITLTYVEKPYYPTMLNPLQYIQNKTKNVGYIGTRALNINDFWIINFILFFVVFMIIITTYYILNKI